MDVEVEQDDLIKSPGENRSNDDTELSTLVESDILAENANPTQMNGNHVDTTDVKTHADSCLLQLIFKDNATFDELHSIIGKCVRDKLFELKKSANVVVNRPENSINIVEISSNENDENIFMVDTLPTDNTNNTDVPNYNSSVIDVLTDVEIDPKDADADDDSKPRGGNCFNCGGDHLMKDCKEKRDSAAIRRAQQQFAQKSKVERYHQDNEQKYSHFVPGKISNGLHEALGLRSRELPLYIYKMRLYGYPEGWLEEAKINHSGLSFINSQNKRSADQSVEDDEMEKVTFDATKFIEYPGFNAPIPSNLIDDSDFYDVPPIQFCNTKEGLTQLLQANLVKRFKRKRPKLDNDAKPSSDDVKGDDMDIEESDEDTNESPVVFPQPRSSTASDESNSMSEDVLQASLLELKQKQEEILKALEDASSDSEPTPSDSNDILTNDTALNSDETPQVESDDTTKNDETNVEITTEICSGNDADQSILDTTVETNQKPDQLESVQNTPRPSNTGHSRMEMVGTPLIKQVSPYSKLPVGEKWSVGVTDVIDFENLPDATGAYQKLNSVITKVRSTIKRLNNDTEHDSS